METRDVLADAFGRITEDFDQALTGLTADQLAWRPDPYANSIAWLAWHATRIQDDHVSELAERPQSWGEDGFHERFGLPFEITDHGWGHTSEQVAEVRPEGPEPLLDYLRTVTDRTLAYLDGVDATELERIVDRNWDPPVSVGVRLVSVVDDSIQHAGQALYVRGMLERRG